MCLRLTLRPVCLSPLVGETSPKVINVLFSRGCEQHTPRAVASRRKPRRSHRHVGIPPIQYYLEVSAMNDSSRRRSAEGTRLLLAAAHVRTIADEARDQPAANSIMGHADESMAAAYRERISDERLRAVTDHVRGWLFPKESSKLQMAARTSARIRLGRQASRPNAQPRTNLVRQGARRHRPYLKLKRSGRIRGLSANTSVIRIWHSFKCQRLSRWRPSLIEPTIESVR